MLSETHWWIPVAGGLFGAVLWGAYQAFRPGDAQASPDELKGLTGEQRFEIAKMDRSRREGFQEAMTVLAFTGILFGTLLAVFVVAVLLSPERRGPPEPAAAEGPQIVTPT